MAKKKPKRVAKKAARVAILPLANAIVDRLLTVQGVGRGDRLAIRRAAKHGGELDLDTENDLGGWSRGAAIVCVRDVLAENGV